MSHEELRPDWKRQVLTRAELDVAQCSHPDCKHEDEKPGPLVLVATCCDGRGVPVVPTYTPGAGVLELKCFICDRTIARVAVAP